MTTPPRSIFRDALSLLSTRLMLRQIILALLVILLSAAWLRIPDASALDVAASVLLGLIILMLLGEGEAGIILRLVGVARTRRRMLVGALWILLGVALWFAWSALVNHIRPNDSQLAGYLNSRFPASLRNFFSYEHFLLWLSWMWSAFEWIGDGIIALFVFAAIASSNLLRSIARALRCFTYWIAMLLGATAATWLTGSLVNWTPGHGLHIEMVSLVLRLSAALLADALVVCLLLAILAACIHSSEVIYSTPAGTPKESQPLTVENP